MYTHSNYTDAFEQFMQTGERDSLDAYLEGERPAAFLSVYRNGFMKASIGALQSNYPTLVKLWGEDYFSQVAAAYVNVAPPVAATLVGYGFDREQESETLSFTDFMKNQFPDIVEQFPYMFDVCHLDQAWLEALNENGESFLTLEYVQELISQGADLAELPIALVDSSRIANLEFDIFELWGQLRFGEISENQNIDLKEHVNSVVFWQRDLQVQARPLIASEAVFMRNFKESADFDMANNQALASDEDFDVSTIFADLLNAQLLQQKQDI